MRWSMSEGAVSDFEWWWWFDQSDVRWRACVVTMRRLNRYKVRDSGSVVLRILWEMILHSIRSQTLNQWRDFKIGVMCWNFGACTTIWAMRSYVDQKCYHRSKQFPAGTYTDWVWCYNNRNWCCIFSLHYHCHWNTGANQQRQTSSPNVVNMSTFIKSLVLFAILSLFVCYLFCVMWISWQILYFISFLCYYFVITYCFRFLFIRMQLFLLYMHCQWWREWGA